MSSREMPGTVRLGVVVAAAGSGTRMAGMDKVFAPLRGKPVLAHCLDVFQGSETVEVVALVLGEANVLRGRQLVEARGLSKVVAVTSGGARRQDSVRIGLEALAGAGITAGYVAVHDGVRPFVDDAMIERGLDAAVKTGAAVAAVPVNDTIKEVGPDGVVADTPDRSRLWSAQTPQVFTADLLEKAHREIRRDVTDDGVMVELIGGRVSVFEGSSENVKITTPEDLLLAELIAADRAGDSTGTADGRAARQPLALASAAPGQAMRWGIGFDGHKLVPGLPLKLGGIRVPFEFGLEGHSDGDVLLHAIADAVLGASGLGDLGTHFPSTAPELAGIDSRILVRKVVEMASERGWSVAYVDATIVAQRPKLGPYLERMRLSIAETLGVEPGFANVKATSTDRVGAIGRGEGIAAQAIATLRAS